MDDFIIKVIIAIVAAAAGPIVKSLLIPLYIEKFRETTKIKPLFFGRIIWGGDDANEIKMEIEKNGYTVKGELVFIGGRHSGKRYKLEGSYNHGYLNFTYKPVDKGSTSSGAGLFQRMEDGNVFRGMFVYTSQQSGIVESIGCEFKAPPDKAT